MKKIKNIKDLEYEKLKLRVKQLELEKQMERSWKQVLKKISLSETAANNTAQSKIATGSGNPILTSALSYGASFLSHKLGMLAGKKVEGFAEQVLENLSGKIGAAVSRKKKV